MEEKKYKVSDFAKNLGVTAGFLKYHEKYDLLQPEISDNGYRYYSNFQDLLVFQCLHFQSLGFSSEETASILNHSPSVNLPALNAEKKQEIQHQIDYYTEILHYFEQLEQKGMQSTYDGKWKIDQMPPFLYVEYSEDGLFYRNSALSAVIAQWNSYFPMVSPCSCVQLTGHASAQSDSCSAEHAAGHAADRSLDPPSILHTRRGLMVEAAMAEKLGIPKTDDVQTIHLGTCLCYHLERVLPHPARSHGYPEEELLADPLQLCRSCNLTPGKQVFILSSFTSTASEENQVSAEVIIPLQNI